MFVLVSGLISGRMWVNFALGTDLFFYLIKIIADNKIISAIINVIIIKYL